MNTHHFENLDVWKRSCRLATDACSATHNSKLFALRDQIQKSAISIPSNIAEGAERPTTPDFLRFLGYSKGSAAELRTQLLIFMAVCKETNSPMSEKTPTLVEETREISKMIQGLVNHLLES
ncbi:four helix bundle protein [Akkermansiaceae bacterium]|nr:four helix bundle protein [Akkermansiaceae bacterium]